MQSLVHCCVEQVAAQLNTASHSGSFEHWRPCEQQDDLRHDAHALSDAFALQVVGAAAMPPLVPPIAPLVPLVPPDVPLVPPLVPPKGPPLVPVPLPVVVPLHAAEATSTATQANVVMCNAMEQGRGWTRLSTREGKLWNGMDLFF